MSTSAPTRPTMRTIAAVPFLLLAAAHIVLLLLEGSGASVGGWATITKGLLMPALLLAFLLGWFAVRAGAPRRPAGPDSARVIGPALVVWALVFSWLGDISLSVTEGAGFLLGLGFFLVAHLAWITVFVRVLGVRRPPRPALVYLLWLVVFVVLLAPHTSALLFPVALYGAVLALVAAFGLGGNRFTAWGSALFLVSDSLLGLHTFYPGFSLWQIDAVIMSGYLAGQALMAVGVLRHLAAPGRRELVAGGAR
jgi:uncharacterized membrane protein YhhN